VGPPESGAQMVTLSFEPFWQGSVVWHNYRATERPTDRSGYSVRCGVIMRDKKNKISARCPTLASARIAPKICQSQLQTIYSQYPKSHPNPYTSGGVIAGRVNIVETRHKVFQILGEATASSPSSRVKTSVKTTARPEVGRRHDSVHIYRRFIPTTAFLGCIYYYY